ncbi:MAG: hypothetical protein JXR64_02815 [Spirochaetales bacterium]|nr:hypothetical protein [Spirochaetales bacterium]
MNGLDYRHYARRIKDELMKEDADKYKTVSVKAITAHIKHIGWCMTQIVLTHNDGFSSSYFNLHRGFKKYFHAKYHAKKYKEAIEREKRLAEIEENEQKQQSEIHGIKKELNYWADIFNRKSYR